METGEIIFAITLVVSALIALPLATAWTLSLPRCDGTCKDDCWECGRK